jgi:hypothetical protein
MVQDNLQAILDKQYEFMTKHNFQRYANTIRKNINVMYCNNCDQDIVILLLNNSELNT